MDDDEKTENDDLGKYDDEESEEESSASSFEEEKTSIGEDRSKSSLSPRTSYSQRSPRTPYALYSSHNSSGLEDAFMMGEAASLGSSRSSKKGSGNGSQLNPTIHNDSSLTHVSATSFVRLERGSLDSGVMQLRESVLWEPELESETTAEGIAEAEDEESNHYWSDFSLEQDSASHSVQVRENSNSDWQGSRENFSPCVEVARRGPLQSRLSMMLQIPQEVQPQQRDWRTVLAMSKNMVASEGVERKAKTVVHYRSLRSTSSLSFGVAEQCGNHQETIGGSMSSKQEDPEKNYRGADNVWLAAEDFSFLYPSPPSSCVKASQHAVVSAISQDVLDWHIWNLSREHEHVLLDSHELWEIQDTQKHSQIQKISSELLQIGHGCQGLVQSETEALMACSAEARGRTDQFQAVAKELQVLDSVLQAMHDTPIEPMEPFEHERCLRANIASKDKEIERLEEYLASLRRFSSCDDPYVAKRPSISDGTYAPTFARFPFVHGASLDSGHFDGSNVAMRTCSSSDVSEIHPSEEPSCELLKLREEIRSRASALRARRDHCRSQGIFRSAPSPPTLKV